MYAGNNWFCMGRDDTVQMVADHFGQDAAALLQFNVTKFGNKNLTLTHTPHNRISLKLLPWGVFDGREIVTLSFVQ